MSFPTSPTNGQIYNGYKYNNALNVWELNQDIPNDIVLNSLELNNDLELNGNVSYEYGYIEEYNYHLEALNTVGNLDSYLSINEGFEIFSIVPEDNSQNYLIKGCVNFQSSVSLSKLYFDIILRSNILPDLSEKITWSIQSNDGGSLDIIPLIWKKEVNGSLEWKFLIKVLAGFIHNTSIEYKVYKRSSAYPIVPLALHRDITSVDSGYEEITSDPIYKIDEYGNISFAGDIIQAGDTNWTTVTALNNGWAGTIYYKKSAGWVTVNMTLDGSSATDSIVALLPETYRPAIPIYGAIRDGDSTASSVTCSASGEILCFGTSSLIRGSISYPII